MVPGEAIFSVSALTKEFVMDHTGGHDASVRMYLFIILLHEVTRADTTTGYEKMFIYPRSKS
jgi:hypothetical protein